MTIRVYTGRGTARKGSPLLVHELQKHGQDAWGIDHNEMLTSSDWKKNTSMLIFAGQSVREFKAALGEEILSDIQHLVHEGAFDYTGICAGAAFASAQIKYRVIDFPNTIEKKITNTGLGFFNGLATGPSKSITPLPFSGGSENLLLIRVRSIEDQRSFYAFHWGGPALIPLAPIRNDEGRILSTLYDDGTPLSYRLKYGQGNVTIYSYHPEINAKNIHRWAETRLMTGDEAERLERLAHKMDDTAFERFLDETGIVPKSKAAAPSPWRSLLPF